MLEPKDPDAVLDYRVDFALWLAGDTIATVEFFVADGVVVIDSSSHDATSATVWLSGGSAPSARLTCRITTAGGRATDKTFTVRIRDL